MSSPPIEPAAKQGIQSIEIGFRILSALQEAGGALGLSDLGRRAGLHPAKVHRYLVSLIRIGLASRDPATGLYDLGPAARELGIEALRRLDPVNVASTAARELREETQHSTNVAVWGDHGPLIVRADVGAHLLPIVLRVGSILPMLDSAIGNVFLAFLPRLTTAAVLAQQEREKVTLRRPAGEVKALVDDVRRAGFASSDSHLVIGLAAVSAPIFGADGSLQAAIALLLPAGISHEMTRLAPVVRAAAARASRALGAHPSPG